MRAGARLRLDADGAAHQFDQTFGNRETQAGSSKAAADGSIGLTEGFEQPGQLVRSNPHAGVTYFNLDQRPRRFLPGHRSGNGDPAGFREFQRVGYQVEDDLTQSGAVAAYPHWKVRRQPRFEPQAFLDGSGAKQLHAVLQATPQFKRSDFQIELSSFDLGKIKNVIYDAQEGIG